MSLAPSPRPRVLIVEDQALLRQSMSRGLSSLRHIDVVEAASLTEAKRQIARQVPDLLLSDLQLPDGTGIDLLATLDRLELRVPIVFISGYLGEFKSRIPARMDIEVREKPVPMEELRRLVLDKLSSGSGTDAPFALSDYLQLAVMGRYSLQITIERDERPIGRIVTHQGEVWAARDDTGSGDGAVQRLFVMCAKDGRLRIRCNGLLGETPPRDVREPGLGLLMDAARLMDEGNAHELEARRSIPAPKHRPEDFDALFDAGVDALLRRDLNDALAAFDAAARLRPTNPLVIANLKRLADLGYGAKEPEE